MPIHISAVCDDCKKFGLRLVFDKDSETCADLKQYLISSGWIASDGEGTKDVALACPACVNLRT
jgi:hypothetical protein